MVTKRSGRLVKTLSYCLVVTMAALASGSPAQAGAKSVREVQIFSSGGTPTGAMGSVRDAAESYDSTYFIRCNIFNSTSTAMIGCDARDALGRYVSCSSTGGQPAFANMQTAISSVGDDSIILFSANPTTGRCTLVQVTNGSGY